VSHVDGVLAAVSVIEDADGVRRLHINNREQEGSSVTRLADARQAWLPLMLHPDPKRVLFLGFGTGVTASSAVQPGLTVDAVELLPEVVDAAAHFVPALARADSAPGLRVVVADARRSVRAGSGRYDVIVADLFHPARSGAASLFTEEHFAAVRRRLAPGGCSASGCRCINSISTVCVPSSRRSSRCIRTRLQCWLPTAWTPP
jgi:spermidine synthase